jgi:hypothetical protein
MSEYHLSLSIGKALWDDLVLAALPVQVADGAFDLGRSIYQGVKQLQVRQKVSALIEDKAGKPQIIEAKKKASALWHKNKGQIYHFLQDMLRVEGDWKVILDDKGTNFHYSHQEIGVDAHVKAVLEGKAFLLKDNLELPFAIEKRIGASCKLGDIRYDKDNRSVVGSVQSPMIDLGEHVILQVLNEGIGKLLEQQTARFNNIPIIKKDQLEEMVMPAGGPLKLSIGIDDVRIEVTDKDLQLKIRFGFSQKQLTGE